MLAHFSQSVILHNVQLWLQQFGHKILFDRSGSVYTIGHCHGITGWWIHCQATGKSEQFLQILTLIQNCSNFYNLSDDEKEAFEIFVNNTVFLQGAIPQTIPLIEQLNVFENMKTAFARNGEYPLKHHHTLMGVFTPIEYASMLGQHLVEGVSLILSANNHSIGLSYLNGVVQIMNPNNGVKEIKKVDYANEQLFLIAIHDAIKPFLFLQKTLDDEFVSYEIQAFSLVAENIVLPSKSEMLDPVYKMREDINVKCKLGRDALTSAVLSQDVPLIKQLLACGATNFQQALITAACINNLDLFQHIFKLRTEQGDFTLLEKQELLLKASYNCCYDIAAFLLKSGVTYQKEILQNVFHYAIENDDEKLLNLILNFHPEFNIDQSFYEAYEETGLAMALKKKSLRVARELIARKAKLTCQVMGRNILEQLANIRAYDLFMTVYKMAPELLEDDVVFSNVLQHPKIVSELFLTLNLVTLSTNKKYSLLAAAIRFNLIAIVCALLKEGSLQISEPILRRAIIVGTSSDIFEILLTEANEVSEKIPQQMRLCSEALEAKNLVALSALLKKFPECKKQLYGIEKQTLLTLALATRGVDVDFIKELIALGCDPNFENGDGATALMNALEYQTANDIREYLLTFPYDVNKTNKAGVSLLFLLFNLNNEDVIKTALMQPGANVNLVGDNELTILMAAILRPEISDDLVLSILEKTEEALLDKITANGNNILHLAVIKQRSQNVIDRIIARAPNLVHSKNLKGQTPLLCAAKQGNFDCMAKIHDAGGSLTTRDQDHVCALFCAVKYNNKAYVEYLLKLASDWDVEQGISAKFHPLAIAIEHFNVAGSDILQLLLQVGFSLNALVESHQGGGVMPIYRLVENSPLLEPVVIPALKAELIKFRDDIILQNITFGFGSVIKDPAVKLSTGKKHTIPGRLKLNVIDKIDEMMKVADENFFANYCKTMPSIVGCFERNEFNRKVLISFRQRREIQYDDRHDFNDGVVNSL